MRPLCECGHTWTAHTEFLRTSGSGICEYALAFNGHGCGCSEYDPAAEGTTLAEAVIMAKNRMEMARVYAELMPQGDFPTLNRAIKERWSLSGLAYIKRMAWSLARESAAA